MNAPSLCTVAQFVTPTLSCQVLGDEIVVVTSFRSRHAATAVTAPITPAELVEGLKQSYGVSREEDLRGRTPNSFRTLQRWKKQGWPQSAAAALEMLAEAGLLRQPGDPDGEGLPAVPRLAQLGAAVAELISSQRKTVEDLAEVRKRLDALAEATQVRARAAPRRKHLA